MRSTNKNIKITNINITRLKNETEFQEKTFDELVNDIIDYFFNNYYGRDFNNSLPL